MSLRGKSLPDLRDQRWIDLVAEHGHAIVKVADAIDEPSGDPPFAYSLGAFESYGAPELIVFGLEDSVAASVINEVMDEYQAGRRFHPGAHEIGVFEDGIPAVFREVQAKRAIDYATYADWYYEREPFPLWQLFWPAKNGCFPWDCDYPAELRGWQPDLTAEEIGRRGP